MFSPEEMVKSIPAARIISIAPVRFEARMQVTRGFRDYVLEPAKRGKWTFLDIQAEMLHLADFHEDRRVDDKPVYEDPRQRAQKLVSMWGYAGFGEKLTGRYGVAVLPPGELEPSPQLLEHLTREQEALANSLQVDALDKVENGQGRQILDRTHRAMVEWLLGNAATELSWFGRRDFAEQKSCPGCMKKINMAATRCEGCGVDLIEWHAKYDPECADDPAVAKILHRPEPPVPPPVICPPVQQQRA